MAKMLNADKRAETAKKSAKAQSMIDKGLAGICIYDQKPLMMGDRKMKVTME